MHQEARGRGFFENNMFNTDTALGSIPIMRTWWKEQQKAKELFLECSFLQKTKT